MYSYRIEFKHFLLQNKTEYPSVLRCPETWKPRGMRKIPKEP